MFDQPVYAKGKSVGAAKRGFVMADPALDLLFDDTDPTGTYVLDVTVRDNIAKSEAKTTYDIRVRRDV